MTQPADTDHGRRSGAIGRWRSVVLAGIALQAALMISLSPPAAAQPAPNARPLGGVVVGGAATISQSASTTTILQSTNRAAANWQSFNVGSQQIVSFEQPNASAITLNTVVGPNPSQIAGKIDANGQVALVNQSGVTFYKGSQVNTAGLAVSTAGADTAGVNQFVKGGKLVLNQPGKPNAGVSNAGMITVAQAGLAALVAPQVANSGTITARLGHIVLAGAKTATLDLNGDGLLSVAVIGKVTKTPTGATALVTNTGTITADGGTVQLTAKAADGILQTLLQAGGKISANTVGARTGTVVLKSVGGSIVVTGQLAALGGAAGTTGGSIEVDGNDNVTVAATSGVDASGQAGGGVLAIGTTLARARGGPSATSALTAANTTIASGATISANATANGNGGTVTVLSSGHTSVAGGINARGGPQGGNGGLVEESGATLSPTGPVDVSAPMGSAGTVLLDPSAK